MRYLPLLDVSVEHPFFPQNSCTWVSLDPTPETRVAACNHRCEILSRFGGVRVLLGLDGEGKPLLPWESKMPWRFSLIVEDPNFFLITDLSEVNALPSPRFIATEGTGIDGRWQLTSAAAGSFVRGAIGEVEVTLRAPLRESVDLTLLKLEFRPLKARWAYYCVTDLKQNGNALTIEDATPGVRALEKISFSPPMELVDDEDSPDLVAKTLALQFPHLRRIRFLSNEKVPCRQRPQKHLELRRGAAGLTGPLPCPSTRHRCRPEGSDETCLFQIVRYFTNPLSNYGD